MSFSKKSLIFLKEHLLPFSEKFSRSYLRRLFENTPFLKKNFFSENIYYKRNSSFSTKTILRRPHDLSLKHVLNFSKIMFSPYLKREKRVGEKIFNVSLRRHPSLSCFSLSIPIVLLYLLSSLEIPSLSTWEDLFSSLTRHSIFAKKTVYSSKIFFLKIPFCLLCEDFLVISEEMIFSSLKRALEEAIYFFWEFILFYREKNR